MVVTSRYQERHQLRKHLEQRLRPLRVGEPLPPVRSLIVETGASQGRLVTVLREMQRDGLIERRPRQGIFKAQSDSARRATTHIELIVHESTPCQDSHGYQVKSLYTGALIEAFTREAGARRRLLRMHRFDYDAPLSAYEELAQHSDMGACVLVWVHNAEIPRIFSRSKLDWISVMPSIEPHERCITNGYDLVEKQLGHLWELGHRRIGYIWVRTWGQNYIIAQRRESYYRLMAEKGGKVEPHWVAAADYEDESIAQAMGQLFSRPPYPTAIIMADPHLPQAYRFLQERGLRIGRDVSVVGTDDVAIAALMHPSATSAHNSPQQAVQMALDSLDALLQGGDIPPVQHTACELVVRDSTGPAPVS